MAIFFSRPLTLTIISFDINCSPYRLVASAPVCYFGLCRFCEGCKQTASCDAVIRPVRRLRKFVLLSLPFGHVAQKEDQRVVSRGNYLNSVLSEPLIRGAQIRHFKSRSTQKFCLVTGLPASNPLHV